MFDTVNRDNTNAVKWERFRKQNLLPMWVADMDLASPPAIVDALSERVKHPLFGYTHPWPSLNQAVVDWCQRRYQWSIDPAWVVWMPGVVPSFNLAIDLFGKGGKVIVQSPNYPPMLQAAERNGCTTVTVGLEWLEERWQLNWQALETAMAQEDCHLFVLCNPMNPHGATLTKQDLTRLADLCKQHNVFLCSDEIHCDLILDGSQHVPAGSIADLTANSVTLMAASKTFNVAGLGCSFAIIPNADMRRQWSKRMEDRIPYPNFLGMIAAETAFTACDEWHRQLIIHLKQNQDFLSSRINQLNGVRYRAQPATFLAWVESTQPEFRLDKHVIASGIMPSEGKYFGDEQHVRLNFGTGFDLVERAVELLESYWRQNNL